MQSHALLGGILMAQIRYPFADCEGAVQGWAAIQWVQYHQTPFHCKTSFLWNLVLFIDCCWVPVQRCLPTYRVPCYIARAAASVPPVYFKFSRAKCEFPEKPSDFTAQLEVVVFWHQINFPCAAAMFGHRAETSRAEQWIQHCCDAIPPVTSRGWLQKQVRPHRR